MAIPTRYSTFLNKSLPKQQKTLHKCRSLKVDYIQVAIPEAIVLLVCTDIDFVVTNENICIHGALIYRYLQMNISSSSGSPHVACSNALCLA